MPNLPCSLILPCSDVIHGIHDERDVDVDVVATGINLGDKRWVLFVNLLGLSSAMFLMLGVANLHSYL